jgi:hypothetical protein
VKLDFSATNFKAKVTGWRLSIENKADTLFPTVCDTARGIAGIAAATADLAQSEHHDPQILARANLASEDEDSAAEDEKDNDSDNNGVDENHSNGGDDLYGDDNVGGNLDGHDNEGGNLDDHDNEGGDLDDHDNEGGHLDDHDNEGDNESGGEEDEGMAGLSTNGDDDHSDEIEKENYVDGTGSDLTDIGSDSDEVEVVSAPRSRTIKKRVQRGRY